MPPLRYHAGQIAIQEEAKTTHIAERLAHWVGPVAEFALDADLFLLATTNPDGTLGFTVLSGAPPLVEARGETRRRVRHQSEASDLRIQFKPALAPPVGQPTPCGGLAISLAQARRARINGLLKPAADTSEMAPQETFTLCRKYMAPSLPLDDAPHLGPKAREPLLLDDPWLADLLSRTETAFLASVSPQGMPDVAHRGGPPGFLDLNVAAQRLEWSEYVGDGVFKSAGNVRANGVMTLLVPDLESGDGVELIGRAAYRNLRAGRDQRLSPLEQHREDFPVQGVITCEISRAVRLRELIRPRRRLGKTAVTSRSTVDEQAPQ
ncbi:MAG: hypothetical protein KatS3mg053_1442 [Candidatus Roseilinea sp.]|nr:MAG: hypothetical protein KatS3mg053_1442 [Candidatus Roseilinea sp.]